jgi:FkbM family methyltransferase
MHRDRVAKIGVTVSIQLRRIAERFSRGIVLKRRLPREFSGLPIYVSPEASLRYWLPMSKADGMIYRMARELVSPGDVVWDVGANVGLFSLCAAARAGETGSVLSIEPDNWLCNLLNQSARTSPARMRVLCAAISDRNGVTELEISERSRAANHLIEASGSSQSSGGRRTQAVMTATLDSLLGSFPSPSVLKIDAETHELKVLLGAEEMIRSTRPKIWCEVSPENSLEVFELLRCYGYELYGAAASEPRAPLTTRAWWDTLAIPA